MNRNILTCELFIFIILVINPSFKYMDGLGLRDLIDTFFFTFCKIINCHDFISLCVG